MVQRAQTQHSETQQKRPPVTTNTTTHEHGPAAAQQVAESGVPSTANRVLQLQQNIGNQATARLIQTQQQEAAREATQPVLGNSDPRGIISGLHPTLQSKVRALVENAHKRGLNIQVFEGMRSIERQNALYAQGRDAQGNVVDASKIVTKVKGGNSHHNYGVAVDVVFHGDKPWGEHHDWAGLGKSGEEAGLEWGGSWKGFVDRPHFQLSGLTIAQLKAWHAAGGMENVWKNVGNGVTADVSVPGSQPTVGGLTDAQVREARTWYASHKNLYTVAIVKQIQSQVGATADGVIGPQTIRAIADWQRQQGVTADGLAGEKTLTKMFGRDIRVEAEVPTIEPEAPNAVPEVVTPPTTIPETQAEVQMSSARAWYASRKNLYTVAVIKQIQAQVGVATDGAVGPQTIQAIATWQRQQGLTSDGLAGEKTLIKMFGRDIRADAETSTIAPEAPSTTPKAPTTVPVTHPTASGEHWLVSGVKQAGSWLVEKAKGLFSSLFGTGKKEPQNNQPANPVKSPIEQVKPPANQVKPPVDQSTSGDVSTRKEGNDIFVKVGDKEYKFKHVKNESRKFEGHCYTGNMRPEVNTLTEKLNELKLPTDAARILAKVSQHEGGFDTIQTYDRAKFSWGFIQFAGTGGLHQVLNLIKKDFPEDFQKYFGSHGIDVDSKGKLIIHKGGETLTGDDALTELQGDPSLWGCFLKASKDVNIQSAQVKTAYNSYFVPSGNIKVTIDGNEHRLGDLYKGNDYARAVLFDRTVQLGAGGAKKLFQRAIDKAGVKSTKPADLQLILSTAKSLDGTYQHRWTSLEKAFAN